MRTLAIVLVSVTVLAGAPASLGAQRAHQFELGACASLTRYDRMFDLDNQVGGGGRLAYFFNNVVSAELDGGYQSLMPRTGGASPTLAVGAASLVLNFGGASNLFYILGGYSRLDFEQAAPFRFTDNAIHGGLGDRVFLGERAALRVEVRGIYAPSTRFPGADWAGHVVGSIGLSVFAGGGPASDADADGVPDGIDKCPNTPAGVEVDSVGCQRFKDSDGDGVDDTKDKCPNTPHGTRVDASGCPILFTPERTPVILRGVIFETGKSALKPESFTVLDIVAQSLQANPDIRIEIAGYTDNTGAAATNARLSQARAEAVRMYLATRGVTANRMVANGYR